MQELLRTLNAGRRARLAILFAVCAFFATQQLASPLSPAGLLRFLVALAITLSAVMVQLWIWRRV